ncbi:MAG TPA: hypothetical protein VFG23_16740 [Polyangia bacterium]|nr:hypothetical protein [Polyangia bacterium]
MGLVLAGVLSGACAESELQRLTLVSPARPPRMGGYCPVQVFPKTRPWYSYTDLATIQVSCDASELCVDELRHQACLVGGDTVYGFIDAQPGVNILSATLAVRTEAVAGVPAPPAAPAGASAAASCTPICSPGFACQNGQCIPQCNPACGPKETCTRARICAPNTPAPTPGAATARHLRIRRGMACDEGLRAILRMCSTSVR